MLWLLNAIALAQIQCGTFFFDKSSQNYTLADNAGKRTVEYEVTFNKSFETKPRVVVWVSLLDAKRITAKGYGMDKPITSNETAMGRDQNRRVEFMITKK